MAQRQVSAGRKSAYYSGMALTAVGVLLFLSLFLSLFFSVAGEVGGIRDAAARGQQMMFRGITAMVIIAIGQGLMLLGRVGLAGSGIVLDPERARSDIEPWSRMAGGVVGDVLDEAGIQIGGDSAGAELPFDEKLRRLHKLYEDGILDEAEYQREKQELLDKS